MRCLLIFLIVFLFQSARSSLSSLLDLVRPSWSLTSSTLLLPELPGLLASSPSSRPVPPLPFLSTPLPDLAAVLTGRVSLLEISRHLLFLWTISRLASRSTLTSSSELSARFLRRLLENSWSEVLLIFFTNLSISLVEPGALEFLLRL